MDQKTIGWAAQEALECRGFKSIGRGVKISNAAIIMGAENIDIGDNVRIDAGAKLLAASPGAFIKLGSHIHIACDAILSGNGGITVGDFCAIGMGSRLISASDSMEGDALVGPVFPDKYLNVRRNEIVMRQGAIVTTACTVLPGVVMGIGSVLGANSLMLTGQVAADYYIHSGIPALSQRQRRSFKDLEAMENSWRSEWALKGD